MNRWAHITNNFVDLITEQEDQPTVFTEGDAFWVDVTGQFVGPGFKYFNGEFSPPDPPPVIRTRLEIINLLGSDYAAIITASKADVEVEIWLEKFRLTESFDMSNQSVKDDIQLLVTKNLISQQKANNILGL